MRSGEIRRGLARSQRKWLKSAHLFKNCLDIKLVIFVTERRKIRPKIERKEADTLCLKSSVTRYKALDTQFKAEFHANFCYIFKA
ncbi:hypothetical protein [Serratia entomophila]|uniref:Uncharacterized protein n=1 Tax=Serratia entomophila TaxID=42906 RepID=A0ABY5CXN3_9GAMM|nr:hypothetical protein [Serratia entomophila]UIW19808.1 hypothetical protein KHA73_07680 [Serratia entomophila]USV02330.1 hypothetical protein KFQ06_07425 [Serratia entomophila]